MPSVWNARLMHNLTTFVRIIRNDIGALVKGDGIGFRIPRRARLCKPRAVRPGVPLFHYGWGPQRMVAGAEPRPGHTRRPDRIQPFTKSHPRVMQHLIDADKSDFDFNYPCPLTLKDRLHDLARWLESALDFRIGEHTNYVVLKSIATPP